MKLIAILLTVHNRKSKTLQCLEHLFAQQVPDGYQFEVYMTDDGCTDGTPEEVAKQFPSVHIVHGDGNLYWNRGMHLAWKTAAKTKDYDFYLWLNDDTTLKTDALSVLLHTAKALGHQAIVVGTTCAVNGSSTITYGGRTHKGGLITPTGVPVLCDFFNGNIVLFPKHVYDHVGMNDPIFHHALGDFDYGMRAAKLGVKSCVAPGILGICNVHESLPIWCNPEKSFAKRWKAFRTPLGQNPEEFFVFERRHNGFGKALFHYLTNHLRLLWPKLWMNKKRIC